MTGGSGSNIEMFLLHGREFIAHLFEEETRSMQLVANRCYISPIAIAINVVANWLCQLYGFPVLIEMHLDNEHDFWNYCLELEHDTLLDSDAVPLE